MVIRIAVTENEWSNVGTIEFESFRNYIRDIIALQISKFEDCEKTVIQLPKSASKAQRYNIHRLSSRGFTSESYDDENGDRMMEISIDKQIVQGLFKHYEFNNASDALPKSDKQKLFETLIGFINENFQSEFDTYLNSL